jgi:hypothetical protein
MSYITQHNITLNSDYTDINRNTIIDYQCIGCKNDGSKSFRAFVELPYCRSCTQTKMLAKYKQTNLDRYGVENPFQNAGVQAKMKATCLDKFGVENPSQNADVQAKMKATCLDKFGVENPFQNADVQAKMKQTNLDRYGVDNPMQSTEIADKSSQNAYKSYDYQLPSGKVIRLQGYEKFAVDFLLSKGHEETDIITARGEVPTIWYKDGNKNRRYFIDIFIPSKKLGIEVKSTYTYESNSNKVQLKQEAFKQAGYECEIWVMTSKGDLLTVY